MCLSLTNWWLLSSQLSLPLFCPHVCCEFVLNLNKSQEKYVQILFPRLLFQVQSGKDSVPRRKAPGIPVNRDTPVRKCGKNQRAYMRKYINLKVLFKRALQNSFFGCVCLFCCMWVCVLAPVRTSPPPPAGEVVKYSSQFSDHIIPSQDVQGNWIKNWKMNILYTAWMNCDWLCDQ